MKVLVEVERVKMAVVCRFADTAVRIQYSQKDLIIRSVVLTFFKLSLVGSLQTSVA